MNVDPEKVHAAIARAEADVAAQRAVVDKLGDLLDEEEHDLSNLEARVERMRRDARALGVTV